MRLVDTLQQHLQALTGGEVTLIETHLSWVLLTSQHAYKLKKPVALGFVDFSSPEARQRACEEELRLNCRMAESLYLAVLPVTGSIESPRLGGDGPPLDWVVQMRRFPPGALWSERLAASALQPGHIDRFAQSLAHFHANAPRAEASSGWGDGRLVCESVQQVFDHIEQLSPGAAGADLGRWLADQAIALTPAWHARAEQGFVRELHGDLHLANVVVLEGDESCAFDCLEFDPGLRWIDVMSDTAFLAMDLWAHGRRDLAFRFLNAYLEHSGDYAGLSVLRHALVYRALVRALVLLLQGRPKTGPQGTGQPDYLALARTLAAEPVPRLLMTHGLPGSGKTHVSQALLEATGAIRLRSDVERKRLHGLPALADSRAAGLDLYTPEATSRTFDHLHTLAAGTLHAGYPTIVDAASLRADERARFRALAEAQRVPFTLLSCVAPVEVLRLRVQQRQQDASEADVAVIDLLQARQDALTAEEQAASITVDTTRALDTAALAGAWLSARARPPRRISGSTAPGSKTP